MAKERIKPYRNWSYERFYAGFSEQEITDENGKTQLHREYIGNFYARKCTDEKLRTHRARCVVCYVFCVCLYLLCAMQDVVYNSLPLTGLLEGSTLVALFFLLFPLYYHIFGARRMIERVYRDASKRYRQLSLAASVCAFATAISILVQLALYRVEVGSGMLLAGGYGICGGILLWLHLEERNAEYEIFSHK